MSGRRTIIAALAGLALATAGGCISQEKYNEALKAQRLARQELLASQTALQKAGEENTTLRADLARAQLDLTDKGDRITDLERDALDLTVKFNQLKTLYDKLASKPPPKAGAISILPRPLDVALTALGEANPELMEYLPKYGMVKLKADLTFDKGSATAKASAVDVLKKLAEIVNRDEAKIFHVYVAGHTDDIPLKKKATIDAHGTNWGLSLHRAGAVVKVLAVAGVGQKRMGAMGFSKYYPVAPNAPGNKGNPLNRRVEIWIVPPDRFLTADGAAAPEPEPEK